MDNRGYYFVDGSRLFSSIHEIWRTKPDFDNQKLDLGKLSQALQRRWSVYAGPTVRIIYYFKKNDNRLRTMLSIPDCTTPGAKSHWQIKECGENIQSVPDDQLQRLDAEWRDHFARQEKGLDIKLACDALILVIIP